MAVASLALRACAGVVVGKGFKEKGCEHFGALG